MPNFAPAGRASAAALDRGMREHLARSLERIQVMAGTILGEDADVSAALRRIRGRRVEPGIFARYYDLVFALQRGDGPSARKLWTEIARVAETGADFSLVPFGPAAIGEDAERFVRLLSIGMPNPASFLEPSPEAWGRFLETWPAAMALLEAADPAWREEVGELTVRVMGAVPATSAGARSFSGASSLMIWGAIVVNVRDHCDRMGVLEVVVHEATHNLLFGLAREEPLVENPVDELYRTELRPIPRPMNAVYHSTFVSGRTAHLCRLVTESCARELSDEELEALDRKRKVQLARFDQGVEVIDRHARLTGLGRRLIDEARTGLAGSARH